MSDIVFLRSTRIILRPILEGDMPAATVWANDPDVTQYLMMYRPLTPEDENEWRLGLTKRPNDIVLAIVAEGAYIGNMGLHDISFKDGTATTGTVIGKKEYWGKGYGTEAKMLLLGYAFYTLGLRKICSRVIAYNERSYKYSVKCGYTEEGRLKSHVYRKGRYWDLALLAVFRDDFTSLWDAFKKEHGITYL